MPNSKSKTSKPSYRYAVLSISIVLYFLGVYMIIFMQSNHIDKSIKEQINIVIELTDEHQAQQLSDLQADLSHTDGVIVSSIQLHDKSEAANVMGEDIVEGMEESPFRDLLTFRLDSESYTDDHLNKLDKELSHSPVVYDIFYESESDIGVTDLIKKLSIIFLVLSLVFIGLALIIIHSTLSLSLYADRWEIKTMELVGARRAFIRRPYIAHGRIIGQRAFLVAAVAILFTLIGLYAAFDLAQDLIYWPYLLLTLLLLFVLSTLITMVSTFTVVNKFLNQKLKELHL